VAVENCQSLIPELSPAALIGPLGVWLDPGTCPPPAPVAPPTRGRWKSDMLLSADAMAM